MSIFPSVPPDWDLCRREEYSEEIRGRAEDVGVSEAQYHLPGSGKQADPDLLVKIRKGSTYEQLVQAARRVKEAGIQVSVTVLLGIGGIEDSEKHARATARILTDMDPDFVGALSVILVPGTELYREYEQDIFAFPIPLASSTSSRS